MKIKINQASKIALRHFYPKYLSFCFSSNVFINQNIEYRTQDRKNLKLTISRLKQINALYSLYAIDHIKENNPSFFKGCKNRNDQIIYIQIDHTLAALQAIKFDHLLLEEKRTTAIKAIEEKAPLGLNVHNQISCYKV